MNQHTGSLSKLPAHARVGFASLFIIMFLVCLPAGATQVITPHAAWSMTGSLATGRFGHTATLLVNGKVLVAGGRLCTGGSCTEFSSAELYDPATGLWSATGNMSVARHAHVAVRLPGGKVLVAGGHNGAITWDSAELFDPDSGQWRPTGNLAAARAFATATLLADGRVLVSGGNGGGSPGHTSAELFDGATAPPQITGASVSGNKLFVEGQGFDDGAAILLNDEPQKTRNDSRNPSGLLIGKKAGKKVRVGTTVRLKVRNADGTESAEFFFTRP